MQPVMLLGWHLLLMGVYPPTQVEHWLAPLQM
jgi:hypothetical protein